MELREDQRGQLEWGLLPILPEGKETSTFKDKWSRTGL